MWSRIREKLTVWANHKQADWLLSGIAFAEASFFPLAPDFLLIPMVLARPRDWWKLAIITTIGSVLGGMLGYAIGMFLMDTLGQRLIDLYGLQATFDKYEQLFLQHGVQIILIKGLTPIPYKLVTIASGLAHFPLIPFTLASLVTRGGRYFLIATILHISGERGRVFIEKHLGWVLMGCLVIGVLGLWLAFR